MPGHGSGLFRQTHLIASGAQNWISQPLVAQDKQFAYASTLAVYVYNNEDQQLQKVRAPSRAQRELSNLSNMQTDRAGGWNHLPMLTPSSRF